MKLRLRVYRRSTMPRFAPNFVVLVLLLILAAMFSSSSCEATEQDVVSLKDFMAARCGEPAHGGEGGRRSIWLYQGELIDLQSGRPIAAVEGVEVVQALSLLTAREEENMATSRTQQVQLRRAYCQRLGDLQIAKTVRKMIKATTTTTTSSTADTDKATSANNKERESGGADDTDLSPRLSMATLLSRKVFFYMPFASSSTSTSSPATMSHSNSGRDNKAEANRETDGSSLVLRKIRLRPGSPERIIPLNQAIVCYETANTILERAVAAPSSGEDCRKEWIMHAEWPNGKTVWNRASVLRQGGIGISSSSSSPEATKKYTAAAKKRRQPSFWKKIVVVVFGGRRRQKPSALPKSRTLEFTVHHGQRPRAAAAAAATLGLKLVGKNNEDNDDDDNDDENVDETLLSALVMTQIKQSKSDKHDNDSDDTTTTISPKRAAIISFGPSSRGGSGGRSGSIARETYQYRMEEDSSDDDYDNSNSDMSPSNSNTAATTKRVPSCTVRYTRYGEGPVWYGPNRMCALELRGRRIDNIPPSLSSSSLSNGDNYEMVDSPSRSSSRNMSIISSPPLLAQLAESLGFRNPSEDYYDVRQDDYGRDAVQSFRQSKAARATQTLLGITNNNNNGQEQNNVALLFGGGSPSSVRTSWFRRNRARLQGRIQTIAGRLREATTVELIRKRGNEDMMED